MNSNVKMLPLAKVEQGGTLCTTEAQDQYFVVSTSGASHKVDLLTACWLYQKATEVVWGRQSRSRKTASAPTEGAQRSTEKWRRKMREALKGSEDTPSK
jgi:hypothetical protein